MSDEPAPVLSVTVYAPTPIEHVAELLDVIVRHWPDAVLDVTGPGPWTIDLPASVPITVVTGPPELVAEYKRRRERDTLAELGAHSAMCGWREHPHGPECASDCPTCYPRDPRAGALS